MNAEQALNALLPDASIRVSSPINAPEYLLGRVEAFSGRERTVRRLCPRLDWKVGDHRYFAFVRPATVWRDGRETEDFARTLDEAARLVRTTLPTTTEPR